MVSLCRQECSAATRMFWGGVGGGKTMQTEWSRGVTMDYYGRTTEQPVYCSVIGTLLHE